VVDAGNTHLVGRENEHLKLEVTDGSGSSVINGIAFRKGAYLQPIKEGKPVSICYTIEETRFNSVQLMVQDIKVDEE
jgi:single-stranded-DNA-specific exonuclease